MADKFIEGKRYRFSKLKYLLESGNSIHYQHSTRNRERIDSLDGREIIVCGEMEGRIRVGDTIHVIHPKCAEEILSSTKAAVKQVANELYREVKTMKTWEMIKALSENRELKFECNGVIAFIENGNEIHIRKGNNIYGACADDEWEQAQEPVDFNTALNSGKRIRPAVGQFAYKSAKEWLTYLGGGSTNWLIWVNGLWEIET